MRDNWRECVFFLTAVLKARDGGETVLLFPVYFLVPVSSSLNSLTKPALPGGGVLPLTALHSQSLPLLQKRSYEKIASSIQYQIPNEAEFFLS